MVQVPFNPAFDQSAVDKFCDLFGTRAHCSLPLLDTTFLCSTMYPPLTPYTVLLFLLSCLFMCHFPSMKLVSVSDGEEETAHYGGTEVLSLLS